MAERALKLVGDAAPRPCPAIDRDLLDVLRRAALVGQARPRSDLFRACALLSTTPCRTRASFVEALLGTLAQGLDRRPVFYRPGSDETSFDERWILALVAAIRGGDGHSTDFLIRSRIAHPARRLVTFLVSGIACASDSPIPQNERQSHG
ncbi:hypothetical protein OCGS_2009 [Oceaniovalibus guishaninsula JLT2003]|uniref:Uncharacterized protein n=1 Tax=Oceaniovalibus guishaninsula JLT2003 TaxID=1231392 RepID=K2H8X5_9RHOB|nr:hypothetical protein [Oceaniovalibus guishaninsula]EKE44028.1 hypothetical protein OCGS_2009 [Oceaniovalibus guishaninsula JLT2003]